MDSKTKEYDLKGKTTDETIKIYDEITDDMEVQRLIWEKTHNYEAAKQLYEMYLKEKEDKSKQSVSK